MRAAEALAAGAAALAITVAGAGGPTLSQTSDPRALTASLLLLLDRGLAGDPAVALVLDGADLTARDPALRTPLHRAAAVSGDGSLIRAMAERGAALDARDAEGRTPLHEAARNPAVNAAAALVAAGAALSPRDASGRTPLHEAARNANPAVGGLLALVGADPCATDATGAPALDAALLERIRVGAPDVYPAARDAFLSCL